MAKKHLPHKVTINPGTDLGLQCVGGLRHYEHEGAEPGPGQVHANAPLRPLTHSTLLQQRLSMCIAQNFLKEMAVISPICGLEVTPTSLPTPATLFTAPHLALDFFLSCVLLDGDLCSLGCSRTHVAENTFKHQILLPTPPPQYWHYGCVLPQPVYPRLNVEFMKARQTTTPVQGLHCITTTLPPSLKQKLHDKILL